MVHVSKTFPPLVTLVGLPLNASVGPAPATGFTTPTTVALATAPRVSLACRLNVYAPGTVIPENTGSSLVVSLIAGTGPGPETKDHVVAAIPFGSLTLAPTGLAELTGSVIGAITPGLILGGKFAAELTITTIVSSLDAPRLSVARKLKVYVPATVIPENVGVRVLPPLIEAEVGPLL
jgi:hypothetical protein